MAQGQGPDSSRRRRARHGADYGRDRHRQGAGGAGDSRRQRAVPPSAFVAVNCAALTESLLEAELFGHAKGRVHGRRRRARGPDRARGRRDALPRRDRHAVERASRRSCCGRSSRERFAASARTPAATSTSASSPRPISISRPRPTTGEFRTDLYYRIHVHHVHMPPLRERTGDIPLLVAHFLARNGRGARRQRLRARGDGDPDRLQLPRQRPPARTHHPARHRHRPPPDLTPDDLPEELLAEPDAPAAGRRRRGGAGKGRTRDGGGGAGAPPWRDRCHRPRTAGQPHHDVAADEEARHRKPDVPPAACFTAATSGHFSCETSPVHTG